ncbi:MAG: hypothetical protein N4A41_07180 [Crocinitomicaceae bacterium]|jgi:hypothetical protein|nr:hypothetical protein [Crocinitomicaceae bacterium]
MRYILFSFACCVSICSAQTWQNFPQLDNPNLPNSYLKRNSTYENLQSKFLIKTPKNYDMQGKVKDVIEHIYFNDRKGEQMMTLNLRFLENGNMTHYFEENMSKYGGEYYRVDKYTYQNSEETLKQVETNYLANTSHTIQKFDSMGYVNRLEYRNNAELDWNVKSYEKGIFDYNCDYQWTKNRDSVFCDYTYLLPNETYQRQKDTWIIFTHEINRNLAKVKPTQYPPEMYLGFLGHAPQYDSLNRIIRFEIIDLTIKSSYNIDQLYEFSYNDRGLLSEVKYSTNGPHRDYIIVTHYKIDYLEFDEKGNWTRKKVVNLNQHLSLSHFATWDYERKISYY